MSSKLAAAAAIAVNKPTKKLLTVNYIELNDIMSS
jgi:hypothetical protein